MHKAAGTIMSYVITGTNSAGVLSLKRHSAVAAIKKAVELWAMAPEMFTLRTQTAALIVMRNFPNSIWPRGRSRSEVRRDRNRAVTIRRFAEFLRRANSEAVGGKPDSSLS